MATLYDSLKGWRRNWKAECVSWRWWSGLLIAVSLPTQSQEVFAEVVVHTYIKYLKILPWYYIFTFPDLNTCRSSTSFSNYDPPKESHEERDSRVTGDALSPKLK